MYLELAFDLPAAGTFHYLAPADCPADPVGRRAAAPFGRRALTGFIVGASAAAPALDRAGVDFKAVTRLVDKEPLFGPDTLALARWMADYYFCGLGQALAAMVPSGRRDPRLAPPPTLPDDPPPAAPTAEQAAAVERIARGIDADAGGRFLLHGVTGSGKTEVYRLAAAHAVASGRQAIVLVPEITLTPQTASRFAGSFPGRVAVLHSGLTPARRLAEWRRIRDGEVDVVIGARSAVFAPAPRLGLVILDEEQESSYKAGDCPRYHARQVALFRLARHGALVLGSATPSVETLYHARAGRFELVRLAQRVSVHARPTVSVVDMNGQPEGAVISPPVTEELARHVAAGNQGLLFLNRRGFSPFVHCRAEGKTLTCPHCSIALTLHKGRGVLLCHYCGHAVPWAGRCPTCGSDDLRAGGAGTERVEAFLARRLPKIAVARLDSDVAGKPADLHALLTRFAAGEVSVLVGTQMIAKGLDFPRVTFVGVLSVDGELALPDFRGYERVHNLLVQVIGRCGRGDRPGMAFVQATDPGADPIKSAIEGDAEGFLQRELERRRDAGYPPFTRLARLTFRGQKEEAVVRAAAAAAAALAAESPAGTMLLGPAPCPIERIARNHRHHLLLKGPAMAVLQAWLRRAGVAEGTRGDVYTEVDIDPVSML